MAVLIATLAVVAVTALAVTVRMWRTLTPPVALFGSLLLIFGFAAWPAVSLRSALTQPSEPISLLGETFRTSQSCQKCHPDQYRSWHATYHRTMTQEATDEAIRGDFHGEPIQLHGHMARPFRKDGSFYMDVIDPEWDRQVAEGQADRETHDPPRTVFRVDRVVGSHHMQVYLTRFNNGLYTVLPLVWHVGENRWISRQASFLHREAPRLFAQCTTWNNNCIYCHNTKPNPGLIPTPGYPHTSTGIWKSKVEELGIACEACHGPGDPHIEANRNPFRRYALHQAGSDDATIVNPIKLSQKQAVMLCARCHGKWKAKPEFEQLSLTRGDFVVAGQPDQARAYLLPFPPEPEEYTEYDHGNLFWPDGTPRTTALEYQGLLQSKCYQAGELTCFSCHSMHGSDPNDQLRFPDNEQTPVEVANRSCVACHLDYSENLSAHTHHPPDSQGSKCYNCHMPFQTYALLKSIRNHRISNPNVAESVKANRPEACTQCHVDQPLSWSAQHLSQWYGQAPPDLTDDQRSVSATVLDLLNGHALQRALACARLGAESGKEAAPGDWRVPLLIETLNDPYPAVRLMAVQSLRKFMEADQDYFDFLATPSVRATQIEQLRRRWEQKQQSAPPCANEAVLTLPDGRCDDSTVERLQTSRDNTPIYVLE